MNLFKKATATIALVTLVSGIFSTGVSASSSTEIEAANALAEAGYIVNHSDATDAYNLNQNVLRQEIAAVARGIAGLEKKTTCAGSFSDVSATTPNTWACYTVEALLDAKLIAANTKFNPEMNISKAEAVGMMVKAAFGDEYAYDSSLSTSWQAQVVEFAAAKGIVASFTNYDTPATRGFVFEAGYNAMVASDEVVDDCDEVSQLLGLCEEDTDTDPDTGTGVVDSGDNVLTAELSAETPEGTDLPRLANGVDVLKFDVTAGSEDVSITAMQLERTGFGESAADEIAVYTEEGRASRIKSFSTSDDIANVTFSPALVVKAGETRTLTVKVNTSSTAGEFAVSLKDITASSTVDAGDIVSNYFDVKAVDAAKLTFSDEGVSSKVKAGEEQADLMKFKLDNVGNLSTDADITVSSITLKEIGGVDQETALENITLTVDGKVIDTVASMDDKYVTFNFDPLLIGSDKNETFTVKADIVGGASEIVQFELENSIDITASSSKYNAVNIAYTGIENQGTAISIEAGELTIYSIDANSDEIRSDKSNVVLGQLKIVNIAGKNLELKNLGVDLTTSNSGVLQVLENVEFEVNGTSYDLPTSATGNGFSALFRETELDVTLPQGTSILTIRADTKKDLIDGTTVTMALDAHDGATTDTYANFRVEETDGGEVVTDLTPDTLSWNTLTVTDSAASISNIPLANVSVVKGATDLVALQFEINAGTASAVSVDKLNVKLTKDAAGLVPATKSQVSQVALYKGSVSESNLLDRVSGSSLTSNGYAAFDGFNVDIAADATQTFVVTVSLVDIFTAGTVIKAVIANPSLDVSLEDDENDTITLGSSTQIGAKEITVSDSGTVTITYDAQNTDNDKDKTILAGATAYIASYDVQAKNEKIDVENVKFTLSDTTSASRDAIKSAKLYLDNTLVATTLSKDIKAGNAITAVPEISTLTVTSPATTAGNVTVNLNGAPTTVALTVPGSTNGLAEITTFTVTAAATVAGDALIKVNGNNYIANLSVATTAVNAQEIATAIGSTAIAVGNVVTVTAPTTGNKVDGSFTNISATTAAATVAVTQQGTDSAVQVNAQEIAAVIDALGGYSAVAAGNVVTITADVAGAQTDTTFAALATGAVATTSVTQQGVTATGSAATTIEFVNLSNLIIDTTSQELRLAIETNNIGYELVGKSITNIVVDEVELSSMEGVSSRNKLVADAAHTVLTDSKVFNVVAGIITPSNVQSLSSSSTQAKIKLTLDSGANKQANENSSPFATVNTLTFSTPGQVGVVAGDYTLYEEGKSGDTVAGTLVGGNLVFNLGGLADNTVSGSKTYIIVPTMTTGDTASMTLLQDGVNYTVNTATIKTNLNSELDFGSRSIN